MGGTAFLIPGKLAEHHWQPTPEKRSFLDRVTGRRGFTKPRVTELGPGTRLIELPPGPLVGLEADFRGFLARRLVEPWEASQLVLDYLDDGVVTVFLRGEQSPERTEPHYYVQVTFSGCAGMAEVCAEVAWHWAALWYQDGYERLADRFFEPFGFVPSYPEAQGLLANPFLPLGRLGYGMYVGGLPGTPDEEAPSRLFELDAWMMESLDATEDLSIIRQLDTRFGPLMADARCRCQLCLPEFEVD
jgi:hypothetical protein